MRIRYGLAALMALVIAAPLQAQESSAVVAAKQHLRSATAASLAAGDLAELYPTDSHFDRRTGATYVYLAQQHQGVDIWGAIAAVAVLPDGKTHATPAHSYQTGLARRANSPQPSLDANAAIAAAEAHVGRFQSAAPSGGPLTLTDGPSDGISQAVTFQASETRLVYQPMEDGSLRLAWATTLTADNGPMQVWSVRVDARSGSVLAVNDLVDRDRWHTEDASGADAAPVSYAPVALETSGAMLGGSSYRVIPWPFESPSHGDLAIVNSPADATASPNGWHDTGAQQFTTTRGNNVWAYLDRDDDEQPDAGTDPDGGASLSFGATYDYAQNPDRSTDAATVNLFYWGNVFHDITYQYGFDEASGNFQVNNFGNGGLGNDAGRLESQSGGQRCNDDPAGNPDRFACYGNANFSTPGDGGAGRMQMYEWVGEPTFTVTAPASIAGSKEVAPGLFGVPGSISGTVVPAITATNLPSEGCTTAEVANAAAISGNIALISRGTCPFSDKARTAVALGASAVIVHNNNRDLPETGEELVRMAISPDEVRDISIPAAFVQRSTGLAMRNATGTVTADFVQPPRRDSDMDAGIIGHEFAHGLSNRLTGGASSTGCLSNGEQMGEGWSDYYGMLITMEDASDTPRGIGTYVTFEGTDGEGIRPFRYTRDIAENPLTYQNVIDGTYVDANGATQTLSVPHGLGSVWSSMVWDMTLDLTDQYGFDQNVYDADGGAGNQIALNLVTQGLKLQGCSPGFVSGRDGILEADTLLYNGVNSDLIWAAFARRGLGLNADQGTTGNPNDGRADFTVPTSTAGENGPNTSGARLALQGPNPARSATTVSVRLEAPEAVTVEVLDLLGRSVRTLHEGALTAGVSHAMPLSTTGLAPGVYIVRAQGETFSATERLTVIR